MGGNPKSNPKEEGSFQIFNLFWEDSGGVGGCQGKSLFDQGFFLLTAALFFLLLV